MTILMALTSALTILKLLFKLQFGGLESVITGLCDEYPRVLRAHRGIFIGLLIILIYFCSLPTTTYVSASQSRYLPMLNALYEIDN